MGSEFIPASLPGRQPGEGYGLGVRVVTDSAARGTWLTAGTCGWSGVYATHIWVDPKENLVGIVLAQTSSRHFLADFENAVDGALFGTFINQGEVCSAGSRVLVQRDIYKKFVEAATTKAKTIKLGPGMDRDNKMGPLVSAEQRDRVAGYLDVGRREAKVAVGGGKPKQFEKGWDVEPTIFYDVDNDAKIAQEEIFGPVMSVIPFKDEADAIRIANASPYGLAAAVWTRDIFKAFRVVKALEAGIVWVNHMQPTFVEAPWGGYKMSGFGRELGHWGVEEYLETKQVFINLDEKPIGWY
jgi:betaine-aldehyde dehydrogenase